MKHNTHWKFGYTLNHGLAVWEPRPVGEAIHLIGILGEDEEATSRASLIAAAPEMLAALKTVIKQYDWIKNEGPYKGAKTIMAGAIQEAKKAIAKAEYEK